MNRKRTEFRDEAYNNLLSLKEEKRVIRWFKKPLKKVGKLHGVTFVTLKPFPIPSWLEEEYKNK